MFTTQESLEAMAGRSPDGKPLVFVSQRDFEALREKYEELLKTVKQRKVQGRWQAVAVATVTSMVIAGAIIASPHSRASIPIEPFGKHFYATNDAVGVHAANAFCSARSQKRQMNPINAVGAGGLIFECVKSAEEHAAEERVVAKREAEPWQFTPSPEHRARCIELRDQLKEAAEKGEEGDPLSALQGAETLDAEADSLKCWSKP
jgi:hypothetical protein